VRIEHTTDLVGNPAFMQAGYEAQKKSIVLLKNKDSILPLSEELTVYIPDRYVPESENFFGTKIPSRREIPMDSSILSSYFKWTQNPKMADVAIVVIRQPDNGRTAGYVATDTTNGGNGFFPISLQYGPYTAHMAREPSLAGDPRTGDVLDRSYRMKSTVARNRTDLQLVRKTIRVMRGKPIIVILRTENPVVIAEFEHEIQALLINFEVSDQAILDLISGRDEPSGLLPMQMPASMEEVELQYEDVPFDMDPYIDEFGHVYDFGFGLNWGGVIRDDRVQKYVPDDTVH
jgi:beta-glucosidase